MISKKQYVKCRQSGKRGFRSVDVAQQALVELMVEQEYLKRGQVYQCRHCSRWHVSTWYPLKKKRSGRREEVSA